MSELNNADRKDFSPAVEVRADETGGAEGFNVWDTVLSQEVWNKKYRAKGDRDVAGTMIRVANALFPPKDSRESALKSGRIAELMYKGKLVPAGRILSGAGTGNRVTLMNCYVMGTMPDSLDGIMKTLKETALTMQQGGGTGTDFSTLRPHKALLKRTGSSSSGPMPFMDMWDAMCKTIMSAGHRRGAMMATMRIDHPNIRDFITAKHDGSRLRNFNVSVLVSDEFMEALEYDKVYPLWHEQPDADWSETQLSQRRYSKHGVEGYVWEWPMAKDIWELLTKSTYEYSEPGVIFIDRINATNNLRDVEQISCTNPCGEQPLPPYGACDLGHVNLARLIKNPYTPQAHIDGKSIRECVRLMVDMLDRVIDVTNYPLVAQMEEMLQKRRIGLGITGLADALAMLGFRYGSQEAIAWTRHHMKQIANTAYERSVELAEEKGKAPAFDATTFNWNFAAKLQNDKLLLSMKEHGLRNCVLLTVAPTGTTSSFYGNVSSGCEPVFAHRITRKMRQPDDTYKEFTEYSYTVRAYAHAHMLSLEQAFHTIENSPALFPTIEDLTIEDHVRMQAACQEFVDASISKTVNVPAETTYEDFKKVYKLAWDLGCKGCTTYRPSEVRGSILAAAPSTHPSHPTPTIPPYEVKNSDLEPPREAPPVSAPGPSSSAMAQTVEKKSRERPEALEGRTYKIKWPMLASAMYVTITHDDFGQLREVFISSKNSLYAEWSVALSVMVSKILQITGDPKLVANELMAINLSANPAYREERFFGSLIAYIGYLIGKHADEVADMAELEHIVEHEQFVVATIVERQVAGGVTEPVFVGNTHQCTACGGLNVKMKEGCMTCDDCGQSNCN